MDLSTTNVWLAIIAVSTLVQAVMVVVGGVIVARRLTRAETAIDTATTELRARVARAEALIQSAIADLAPVAARVSSALDDLADLSTRARRAESEIRTALGRVSTGVEFAKAAVIGRAWPAVGLARGLVAGVRAIRARRAARERQDDAIAVARFVNEGGTHG